MIGMPGAAGRWMMRGAGLLGAGRAAWGGLNPLARNMIVGAGIGAGWGAISDNTSVLGGAAMGAAGGFLSPSIRAGVAGFRRGFGGMSLGGLRSGFAGAGRAAWGQMKYDGKASGRFIGNTAKRGYNSFRGMTKGMFGYGVPV